MKNKKEYFLIINKNWYVIYLNAICTEFAEIMFGPETEAEKFNYSFGTECKKILNKKGINVKLIEVK